MNREAIRIGLWNRESKNVKIYASGKGTLNGKDYRITLFTNIEKKSEKSPDYNIIIEEYTNTQVSEETSSKGLKHSEEPYKEFSQIITEEDLPF